MQIHPDALLLIAGHFLDPDDKAVAQIPFSEVRPDATGIALCSVEEAQRYIQNQENISTEALALLVPEELPPEATGQAATINIRFAAQFKATKDPVLLTGTLIQLGDQEVVPYTPSDPGLKFSAPSTSILKVTVYKDEISDAWDTFLQGPIKALLAMVPGLQICRAAGCGPTCDKFHLPVDEVATSLIQEVWGTQGSNGHLSGVYPHPHPCASRPLAGESGRSLH